jgi:hypothetical protein
MLKLRSMEVKKDVQHITIDLNVILRVILQLANVRVEKKRRNYFFSVTGLQGK